MQQFEGVAQDIDQNLAGNLGLGAILPGAIEDNREFVNGFLQDLEGEGAALFGESLFL